MTIMTILPKRINQVSLQNFANKSKNCVGRIIDNLQIDNRQIDNLANFRQIENRQIDNLSFSKKCTNYKLLTEKLQTCHFRQTVDLQNCNLNFI